jgi:hypothetical protein
MRVDERDVCPGRKQRARGRKQRVPDGMGNNADDAQVSIVVRREDVIGQREQSWLADHR